MPRGWRWLNDEQGGMRNFEVTFVKIDINSPVRFTWRHVSSRGTGVSPSPPTYRMRQRRFEHLTKWNGAVGRRWWWTVYVFSRSFFSSYTIILYVRCTCSGPMFKMSHSELQKKMRKINTIFRSNTVTAAAVVYELLSGTLKILIGLMARNDCRWSHWEIQRETPTQIFCKNRGVKNTFVYGCSDKTKLGTWDGNCVL